MKKFYDIHLHAMDLSHINILAFISREDLIGPKNLKSLMKQIPWWSNFIPLGIASIFPGCVMNKLKKGLDKFDNIRNMLSVLENSIEFYFLVMDYFLKSKEAVIDENNTFEIDGIKLNKIVLCPLMMDFGYKNLNQKGIFYDIPPRKPIQDQVTDLFNAIHTYFHNELELIQEGQQKKFKIIQPSKDKDNKLFEIYPFLGLNTQNYEKKKLEEMFKKYFSGYEKDSPSDRKKKLYEKMGTYTGDIESKNDYTYIFAGVKVYPPLGFNAWPEEEEFEDKKKYEVELDKVMFLYKQCVDKKLPMITHCSDDGFKTAQNVEDLIDPGNKWNKVLQRYPELKINFAHYGSQRGKAKEWKEIITDYIKDKLNVYADFSCSAKNDAFYKDLDSFISRASNPNRLKDRILFGTDFMINLIFLKSYNEYLQYFIDTDYINSYKEKLCSENPERFLFG